MADDSLRIDSRAIYEGPETTTFGISAHLPRARTARESATPVSSRHLVRPIAYPFRANSGSPITTSPNPGGVKSPGYGINSNKSKSWQSVMHFRVFEKNMHYRGRQGGQREPREILVEDLNGDGKDDFALLVHDRLLTYLQQ